MKNLPSETIFLETDIKKVVVTEDRAEIHRYVEVDFQKGNNLFFLKNITPYASDDSLR